MSSVEPGADGVVRGVTALLLKAVSSEWDEVRIVDQR
jgi:hypothetical protein